MVEIKTVTTRNAARTKQRILEAGIAEFCGKGLLAARVDQIAARAKTNVRMLYHYFGSKENLYVAALSHVYERISQQERTLNLGQYAPLEGIERLIAFTFLYMSEHEEFVTLIGNENMVRARFLRRFKIAPQINQPLIDQVTDLLERGARDGVFRSGVDPVHLYIAIAAQCYFHISNRYTLSMLFDRDVAAPKWLTEHHALIRDMVLSYLTGAATAWKETPAAAVPLARRRRTPRHA